MSIELDSIILAGNELNMRNYGEEFLLLLQQYETDYR